MARVNASSPKGPSTRTPTSASRISRKRFGLKRNSHQKKKSLNLAAKIFPTPFFPHQLLHNSVLRCMSWQTFVKHRMFDRYACFLCCPELPWASGTTTRRAFKVFRVVEKISCVALCDQVACTRRRGEGPPQQPRHSQALRVQQNGRHAPARA